jgi:hypothetical protein
LFAGEYRQKKPSSSAERLLPEAGAFLISLVKMSFSTGSEELASPWPIQSVAFLKIYSI